MSLQYTTLLLLKGRTLKQVWYDIDMPAKNIVKNYASDSYYHVYNRGVNKSEIFNDNEDYEVFIGLLKRYLSNQPQKNGNRQGYKKLTEDVALLSYCLMPNHFHLLLWFGSGTINQRSSSISSR